MPLEVLLPRHGLVALRPSARAVLLVAAERVVAQLLLVAQQLLEFADLLAHLAVGRALLAFAGAAHVFEHLLHLVEHGLRIFARAVAGGVLHLVEQLVEILRLKVLVLGVGVGLRVAGHLAHEALGGLAQLLHQLADFLVARAALKRFAQGLLGGAQVALGLRGVAVLELLRHRPQERGDVQEIGVAAGVLERGLGLLEPEIDIGRGVEQLRRDSEAGQRRFDLLWRMVRVENEVAALLDERAGQRIVEDSLRQRHFDRRALAGLARNADGAEPHRHFRARPRVLGEIDGRMPVADAIGGRRQLQGRLGRRGQRARGGTGAFMRTRELRPGAGEPKPILGPVGKRQRAAEVGARLLGRDDRRIAGGRDGEDGDRRGLAAAQDRRLAGPMDRPPLFGWSVG